MQLISMLTLVDASDYTVLKVISSFSAVYILLAGYASVVTTVMKLNYPFCALTDTFLLNVIILELSN